MSIVRTVKYWALAGLLAPLTILFTAELEGVQGWVFPWLPVVGFLLWPTWPIAIAADSYAEPQPGLIMISTTFSIGLNVIVYSVVGVLVSRFFSLLAVILTVLVRPPRGFLRKLHTKR